MTRWARMKGRIRSWLDETPEERHAGRMRAALTQPPAATLKDQVVVAGFASVMKRVDRKRAHTPPDWIRPEHIGRTRAERGTKATKAGPHGPAAARARRRAAARREAASRG